MDLTGCPSVSIGIIHDGETILQHSQGLADASKHVQVNEETVYMIGSLTKAFIAASCGILVEEGKLSWTAPLSTYIPFTQNKDPFISERMSLSDALSHSSGFPQLDISWYGANGEDLLAPEDLLHVTGSIPVFDTFRAELHYSNWPFALAGRVIEAVGGKDAVDGWGEFVKRRIFAPLGMTGSTCCRSGIEGDNLAEAHTVLSDLRPARLPVPQVSHKTICGAAMAIWSNIPDMLIWSQAVMDRLEEEKIGKNAKEASGGSLTTREHEAIHCDKYTDAQSKSQSPLRRISQITSHKFPVTNDTINENTYGFGWARHVIPSSQLGWLSTNGPQKDDMIGRESRPRLALYHGGQVTGYLNSIYLFPETRSAVVVLTNTQSAGDCSDLVAQMLIQALFDMKPEVDFEMRGKKVSANCLNQYTKMLDDLQQNRIPGTACPELDTLEGSYWNEDLRGLIQVDRSSGSACQLDMKRNGMETQRHCLSQYHYDTFSFMPDSRDEMELRCLVDYSVYEQFLLKFVRDEEDRVIGLDWVMQEGFMPLRYSRI
jgi:CubicO group peptidase (beta-lactamase class C family)